jgi:hypothetical protein
MCQSRIRIWQVLEMIYPANDLARNQCCGSEMIFCVFFSDPDPNLALIPDSNPDPDSDCM